eukprot:47183-Pelagomonas_calceolata.AAC.2
MLSSECVMLDCQVAQPSPLMHPIGLSYSMAISCNSHGFEVHLAGKLWNTFMETHGRRCGRNKLI